MTEICTMGTLWEYKDIVIKAVRTVDRGIIGFKGNEAWQKLKIHGVPPSRYIGRGSNGLEKLREGIHAENAGVVIQMAARWLGRVLPLKERWASSIIMAFSVFFAVQEDETACRLLKEGVRLCRNRYTVERYQEEILTC
jgi:hypothetical protein